MLIRIIVVFLGLAVAASGFGGSRFYRYVDENGVRVIRDTIPPELVHLGYDILGPDGRVIKTVPRALTEEELKALAKDRKTEAMLAEEAAKREAADKKLLTIFSTPKDAERARDRKLEALDVLISVNRGNIVRLKSEYEQAQKQAATRERAGQKVPEHLIEKMERIERQIKKLEETIVDKEKEKDVVREQYAKDIERLKYLMRQQGRLVE